MVRCFVGPATKGSHRTEDAQTDSRKTDGRLILNHPTDPYPGPAHELYGAAGPWRARTLDRS